MKLSKYKVGDWVKLVESAPVTWAFPMSRYLGQTVKINSIYRDTFTFAGSSPWSFSMNDIVEKIKIDESLLKIILSPELVKNIAISVFGEDRVKTKDETDSKFTISIYFPEITIRNSKGHSHLIRDLYVDIYVTNITESPLTNCPVILFNGFRTTLTYKEYISQYLHSHLPRRGLNPLAPKHFCTGGSDFTIILTEVSLQATEENWMMLFLSLENYLSWESLEGGPYIKIADIQNASFEIEDEDIIKDIIRIEEPFPINIWDIDSFNSQIVEESSEFLEYLDRNMTIRDFVNPTKELIESYIEKAKKSIEKYHYKFGNKRIKGKIINDLDTVPSLKKPIHPNITLKVKKFLESKMKIFINKENYEKEKKENYERVFKDFRPITIRKNGTDKQAHSSDISEASIPDRLPT